MASKQDTAQKSGCFMRQNARNRKQGNAQSIDNKNSQLRPFSKKASRGTHPNQGVVFGVLQRVDRVIADGPERQAQKDENIWQGKVPAQCGGRDQGAPVEGQSPTRPEATR